MIPAPDTALRRVAMFSVHSCPLATLGGRETGGMNVYVRELSRHLGQQGTAVDVYTRRQDPCLPTVVEYAPQVRVVHLNAGPTTPYTKHRVWYHLPEFIEQVQGFMAQHDLQYQLLYSHYWLSGWVALQLRRYLQVPMVHMSHTLGYPKNAAAQQAWEQEPPRRLQVEHDVLTCSEALIAESPASKHHMVQEYGVAAAKIHVIPGGVDPAVFWPQDRQQARHTLGLEAEAPMLLFVGRLQPLKGIDTFLRAAQRVRQQHAQLQVCIVGGGVDTQDDHEAQELRRLRGLSQALGLSPHVRFIKAQPQAVLAQYYAAADVFVMPSHYESFGMVVLEAMACGTPVVASRVGGLTSTVVPGRTGFLVPEGDWQAFAQAVARLLDSPTLRQACAQASMKRARAFTWPRIVERTTWLYECLLRQHGTLHVRLPVAMSCPL
ncbi:D-inositol 3-phosphate glycosyltransferase [Candidatus Entotheonellaceae bacterium PAL068K]